MRSRRWPAARAILATAVAATLAVSGCSMEGARSVNTTGPNAIIRAYAGEPQNGLVPTDTNEQMGGRMIRSLFTGLYQYDADGKLQLANAQSVDTTDNKHFVVKLKPGWKFTDGTPVKASNYVRAWNFGAAVGNLQKQQDFFAAIDGFEDVSHKGTSTTEMRGLKVVDDNTFTIDLTEPNIDFKLSLGHTPFVPLPDVFFTEGKDKFGQNPIGNGQYKLKQWRHNVQVDMVRNDDYQGTKPKNGGLTFILYATLDAAYADLGSGNLDVMEILPPSALRSYKKSLGSRAMVKPTAQTQAFSIPEYLDHFKYDEEGRLRREAISMSVDRDLIVDKIFFGTRIPSVDFTARTIPGWDPNIPGNDTLKHNPDKAKQLWAQANAIRPWDGIFSIAYNTDGGHQTWVDAVCGQITNTLGIQAQGKPYATFKQIRTEVTARSLKSAARTGWQADYPSLLNFLGPQYISTGSSNDAVYSNPEFDAKVRAAEQAPDQTASNRLANEAQVILLHDLPVVPLWDYLAVGGRADGVNAELTWSGDPDYPNITKE
ncbi:ABC transporter substrate-binding protein [Tsukamurella pseudospumae]|uniref:ABC transporter substrate-binding protein n=2 Tax=Tsukamurella pseudospumae TaxID=239498 RepID=A0A138AJ11_9ACTN|nr:ABC transporter substrate-binding protein [Tsukamurella pseudospumae]